jgi:RNA polymerase sigma-54 factor
MSLSQGLQQRFLQKLSPQQIQLMKLLQVPTANLEERIQEEIEENPALELNDEDWETAEAEQTIDEFDVDKTDEYEDPDGSVDEYGNIDIREYVTDEDGDIADYRLRDDSQSETEENSFVQQKLQGNIYDLLQEQLSIIEIDDQTRTIAEQIVGSIDDDGYLRRETASIVDDLAFRQNIISTEKEVEAVIKRIQEFDPPGTAARNLQECLLLQLYRKQPLKTNGSIHIAIAILEKYFDEFTKKHFDKIQKGLEITEQELKFAIQEITGLNPKPGSNIPSEQSIDTYITPDFFVYNNGGNLELTLNSRNAPDLRISQDYRDMLREYDKGNKKNKQQKEAVVFIKQKIEAAKWFIDAIKQRQHTLLITMQCIINHQEDFFYSGDETSLKPMILKDIAEKANLDISTISRVANSKYVQTEFGTYRLKFFFAESMSTESGEEVSTREVKKILNDFIENEDKENPLSDEKLTELLQQKGYNIARRTVAKYREQLNISVARLRKQL